MKIICHGDSLTQGSDMAKPDTWTSLLGNHLDVPVVNTGISGDTTAGMLARFAVDVVPAKSGHQAMADLGARVFEKMHMPLY